MPIRITFKTPDAVERALSALQPDYDEDEDENALDEDVCDARRAHLDEARAKLAKWIEYGELVTIEFDLDKGTATVETR